MFIETTHGSHSHDEVIRQLQIDLLYGEYNPMIMEEMRMIVDDLKEKYSKLSEDDKLRELFRVVLLRCTLMEPEEVQTIESITGDTKVSEAFGLMYAEPQMIHETFSELANILGSQIYDILDYDQSTWEPVYDMNCTVDELIGIHAQSDEKVQVLKHHVNSAVLNDILESIEDACSGTNGIQRYNLFNDIQNKINEIREQNEE